MNPFDTENGFVIRVKSTNNIQKKYFFLYTSNHLSSLDVQIRVICPNHCFYENNQGKCILNYGVCSCEDGYGGNDCHLKCYHNKVK